jgi:isopropylmalate/isohomocitrate dehydrogenase-like protein
LARDACIAVVPGDGIGPEVTASAVSVLEATGLGLEFVPVEVGLAAFRTHGSSVPPPALEAIRGADAVLFGATTTPPLVQGYRSAILTLRSELGLHANLRPARSVPGLGAPGLDLLLVRENTEGLYSGIEHMEAGGERAVAHRVVTRSASERIAHVAFREAAQRSIPAVLAAHKANVLRLTDGLFLESCRAAARAHPGVRLEEGLVDSVAADLVLRPARHRCIVTTNLFGDILSDVAAGLMGGLGLAASANLGQGHALFEPVHGSAPDIAGQGVANPVGAVRSAALLLRHLGHAALAQQVEAAVDESLAHPHTRTRDVGGSASTSQATQVIRKGLGR